MCRESIQHPLTSTRGAITDEVKCPHEIGVKIENTREGRGKNLKQGRWRCTEIAV